MANFLKDIERRVLPNWRNFHNTLILGELNSLKIENAKGGDLKLLVKNIEDWNQHKTIFHAGDLIGSAFVLGISENKDVKEAIDFVLKNTESAPKSLVDIAKKLDKKEDSHRKNKYSLGKFSFQQILDSQNKTKIFDKINKLRRKTRIDPRNPLMWVELARLYSLIGLLEKAKRAMKVALSQGSHNRYVVRSAVRLFVHSEDYDFAKAVLIKSDLTKYDPWILASAISLSLDRKKKFRGIVNTGLKMVDSNDYNPLSISELASSLATKELINGSHKKSRQLFNKSLIQPNDNSLAQAEWASTQDNRLYIEPELYNVSNPFEALTLDNLYDQEWNKAMINVKNWILDMPFSIDSITIGSHISSIFLDDQREAEDICKVGLMINPKNPIIINNLAYSLALQSKVEEAEKVINRISNLDLDHIVSLDPETKICITATVGLIFFRRGNIEKGRYYYDLSLKRAKEIKNEKLVALATVNMVREEILNQSRLSSELLTLMDKECKNIHDEDIQIMKDRVVKLAKRG